MYRCSCNICWKSHPSSVKLLLHLCQNQLGIFVLVYFGVFCSLPLIRVFICLPILHVLGYVISLQIGYTDSSNFILFKNCFSYSSSLAFSHRFQNNLVYSYEESCWGFDGSWLSLCTNLGRIGIFTTPSFRMHEHDTSLRLLRPVIFALGVLQFLIYALHACVKFTLGNSIHFAWPKWHCIFSLVFISLSLVLGFCMFILYPVNFQLIC